jgi:hypothetical protein
MAPFGAISRTKPHALIAIMMPVLDDHDFVVMMAPAMITMFAKLGARATVLIAMLDDDGFSTRDRRRRYSCRNDCRDDISKLPHDVLLLRERE